MWRFNGSTSDSAASQHMQENTDNSSTPDFQRTRAAIEQTYQKIARTKELIKEGQTARDGICFLMIMLFNKCY